MARILTAIALLLVPTTAGLQETATPSAPIRVSTRLVQIGVIVHDKQGPVDGLTKDDFTVYDRGKPQTISSFSVATAGAAAWPAEQLPPNTFSDLPQYNPAAPGSITIVLLDNLNTLYGSAPTIFEDTPYWMEDHALASAKAHLFEFLRTLGPQDRVALYGLSDTLHVLSDFSTDRSQLLALVEKYDVHSQTNREIVEPGTTRLPQQDPSAPVPPPIDEASVAHAAIANGMRATVTLMALKAIADHVANIPGRKNLVWLTANLPFAPEAMAAILGPAQIAVYPVDGRGLLPRSSMIGSGGMDSAQPGLPEQIRGAFENPEGSSQPTGIDAMQRVADLTGGRAFANGNDLTGAIRDAVHDAAVLYSLGFYINERAADGKFHELKVAVARGGLTVRYPKAYFAARDTPSPQDDVRNNLITAMRSPVESSEIPLQAKIERTNESANSLKIRGVIDMNALRLVENGKLHEGAFDVTIVEQDVSGKILSQSVNHLKLSMPPEQYAALSAKGVSFEKHIEPQAQSVTLRVLVEDPATAKVGSLIVPLSHVK